MHGVYTGATEGSGWCGPSLFVHIRAAFAQPRVW